MWGNLQAFLSIAESKFTSWLGGLTLGIHYGTYTTTTSLLVHRNFYWRFVKTFAARGRLLRCIWNLKCIWQIDIFPHSESLPNVGHTYNFWSLIFQKYSTKTSKQYLQKTCFSLKRDYWYLPSSVHSWIMNHSSVVHFDWCYGKLVSFLKIWPCLLTSWSAMG